MQNGFLLKSVRVRTSTKKIPPHHPDRRFVFRYKNYCESDCYLISNANLQKLYIHNNILLNFFFFLWDKKKNFYCFYVSDIFKLILDVNLLPKPQIKLRLFSCLTIILKIAQCKKASSRIITTPNLRIILKPLRKNMNNRIQKYFYDTTIILMLIPIISNIYRIQNL